MSAALPLCPVYGLGMAAVLAPVAEPSFRVAALPLGRADRHLCGIYLPLVGGDLFGSVLLGLHRRVWKSSGPGVFALSLAWGLLLFPAVYLVTPPVVALADRVPIGVTWWPLLALPPTRCAPPFFGGDP